MHGPKLAKIANQKFNNWLQRSGYQVLGKEFSKSVQSGGWPDFVVKKPRGKVEFIEVKSGKHRLDTHQLEILKMLRKIGRVRVLRLDARMEKFRDETPKELK